MSTNGLPSQTKTAKGGQGDRIFQFSHLGRHTFATTVTLSNGVSLESVAKILGHSSIKHTQIYAKVVASKVKAEMLGVRRLFS